MLWRRDIVTSDTSSLYDYPFNCIYGVHFEFCDGYFPDRDSMHPSVTEAWRNLH